MPSTAETAETYFAAVGRQDLDTMIAAWADGRPSRIVGMVDLISPDGNRTYFSDIFRAFPDFALKVEQIVTEGNSAVVRWSATATFNGTGTFEGLKPNGARIEIEGIDVLEIEDGRIQSLVAFLNGLDLARQLGAVPPAGSGADRVMAGAFNAKTAIAAQVKKLMDR